MQTINKFLATKIKIRWFSLFAGINFFLVGVFHALPYLLYGKPPNIDYNYYKMVSKEQFDDFVGDQYQIAFKQQCGETNICQTNTRNSYVICGKTERCPFARNVTLDEYYRRNQYQNQSGIDYHSEKYKQYENAQGFQIYNLGFQDDYYNLNLKQKLNATILHEHEGGLKVISFFYYYNQTTVDLLEDIDFPSSPLYQLYLVYQFFGAGYVGMLWGFAFVFSLCQCCQNESLYVELKWMFSMERLYLPRSIALFKEGNFILNIFWGAFLVMALFIPYYLVGTSIINIYVYREFLPENQKLLSLYKEQFIYDLQYWNPCENPKKCEEFFEFIDYKIKEIPIEYQIFYFVKQVYYIITGLIAVFQQIPLYFVKCGAKYTLFYTKNNKEYFPIYIGQKHEPVSNYTES